MADLDDIARNLLTLEIDTIISDGITAERMPSDGQALIRIAQIYKDFLDRVIVELEDAGSDVTGLPPFVSQDGRSTRFADWTVVSGGMRTFTTLREAAQLCRQLRGAAPRPNTMRPEHDPILARVDAGCGDVQAQLRRLGLKSATIDVKAVELSEEVGSDWPAFDRETLLTLRRIWETGVDIIVMQTMVHLDGGVITRVLDGWDDAGGGPMRDLHFRAVDVAIARWSFLAETARDLAGFFFGGSATGAKVPATTA